MDEARKLKSILYPLSRDVRNLRTFIHNINNILQAEPQRFAVAAPVGLLSLRSSVKTLNRATRAMKETTDIALQESLVAASLAERTRIVLLRPAAQLNDLARNLKPRADRAYNSVLRIEGYLNPVFVFMAAMVPMVEAMERDIGVVDDKIQLFKKSVSRLVDQELTSGLPADAEKQMAVLTPQFAVIEQETADIAAQTGLLMGKMNRLQELSAKLEVLVRMGAALDGSVQDLVPAIAALKQLGSVLTQVQKTHDPLSRSLVEHVEDALATVHMPTDSLLQLEMRLSQQMEHYIEPVVEPLHDMAESLRNRAMNTHELNGLESTMAAQSVRLGNVSKLMVRLFGQLDTIIAETRQSTHAA